jgi:AraC-like DNA-binding protein
VLANIARLFDCDDVMVLSALPRGALQPAMHYARNSHLVAAYLKELAPYDRASWQALITGRACQASVDDADGFPKFWALLDRFDIAHTASVRLESPVLPKFPGVLWLMRSRSQGAFSADQLHEARRLSECLSGALSRAVQSRVTAASAIDARPALPAHVFALNPSLEPLFPEAAWQELDETLRSNLSRVAARRLAAPVRKAAVPDRVAVADSQEHLWNFHAVRHRNLPALGGKSIVCVCAHPPTHDWLKLRPDDFSADPDVSRLIPSLQYIAANFQSRPSLADIASSVSLSPFHFHRCFTERLGITPKHFLLDCQIDRAKALLTSRRFPLSQIADSCGFSYQSHFTSRFKQAVGHTRLRWQRRSLD